MIGEPESIADRILRLRMEHEADPIAQLLLEVRAEAKATRELLEATKKIGNGNGNGRFSWDFILKITSVLLTAAMIGMFSWAKAIESRVTRIEENRFTAQEGAAVKSNQQVIMQRMNEMERWRYTVESRLP